MTETGSADEAGSSRSYVEAIETAVSSFVRRERAVGSFPGVAWAIGDSTGLLTAAADGWAVIVPARIRATVDTIWDVASLTKPLVTTTLVLRAFDEGKIELREPVSRYLHELADTDKQDLTFIDLLTHRGGFQAWYPLYAVGEDDRGYLDALVRRPLRYKPGTRQIYSCLGFILLYLALQRIYGQPIEELAREKLFEPLGLERSLFSPPPHRKSEIAATEWGNDNERRMVEARSLEFDRFRDYMIWGEVDDGNAWYAGGVAGNAGLFSTAPEIVELARIYLTGGGGVLEPQTVRIALRNYTVGMEENRGLGWQLQTGRSDHPSAVLSVRCFGHTGFTGTSVWVDPDRDLILVFLTNRLHPAAHTLNFQNVRRRFHEAVLSEWDRVRPPRAY